MMSLGAWTVNDNGFTLQTKENSLKDTPSLEDAMDEYQQILALIQTKNSRPITLDPRRTALIVVDMERYYTEPTSALIELFNVLSPGAADGYLQRVSDSVIPNNQKMLACFRALHSPIVFTAIGTETGNGDDLPGIHDIHPVADVSDHG